MNNTCQGVCREREFRLPRGESDLRYHVLPAAGVVASIMLIASSASAFTREAVPFSDGSPPFDIRQDCLQQTYNTCSGWVWVNSDEEGAVWGTVIDPDDCPGGCPNGGAVSDIWFWAYCSPEPPSTFGGLGIDVVDAVGCGTTPLWRSEPLTVYSCVSGDRWTHVYVPISETHLNGQPFVTMVAWGGDYPGKLKFGLDNGIGNLFCWLGYVGTFPGCATTGLTCAGWCCPPPPQLSYVYYTDIDGDTVLDDVCALYGVPYPLAFPYVPYYGYLPNNLMVVVGLDCRPPTAVAPTSWGHVKALYE